MTIPQQVADTIVDPKAYADGDRIDEAFTWLRREAPLAKAHPEGFDPFWAVTRHADIQSVERQNDLFHNGDRAATLTTIEADRQVRAMTGGSPHLVRSLVQMDNPDHSAYRRLTQGAFLPQNLRSLDGRIREIAREFIDHMASFGERCDFARDVAFLYPLRVIMELMGIPKSDEPFMLRLTQELFGATDPDLNRSGEAVSGSKIAEDMQKTVADLEAYFGAITQDRRARNTTAGGLWALLENPDQFAKLKADPSLIPGHVEESVRWVTPVKHFMRTATADAELNGQLITKGDWMMLCYPSGNRDEAVFEDPFRYDIERTPNKHVAFGYGAHVCLGQHLGRMEMRILWEELLPRLESVEFDGTPARWAANFVCGPKTVPIRFKMH
jgi:hypothetical protein